MIVAFAIALFSIIPVDPILTESVDVIEINKVYDYRGRLGLTQIIFWRKDDMVAWRLFTKKDYPLRVNDGWSYVFLDGFYLRRVNSKSFYVSETQYDVEREERLNKPYYQRPGLLFENQGVALVP